MMLQRAIVSIATIFLVLAGCSKKNDTLSDCAKAPSTFAADVLPLIQNKCATVCHNAFSSNAGGSFTNYTEIKAKADLIKFMVETRQMPQIGTLTDAEIKIISCWVDAGAEDN